MPVYQVSYDNINTENNINTEKQNSPEPAAMRFRALLLAVTPACHSRLLS